MAHFYGTMQGNRGETSRMGSIASGITAHVRGWNSGLRVTGFVNSDGNDCFEVVVTRGSNDPSPISHLGEIREETDCIVWVKTDGTKIALLDTSSL